MDKGQALEELWRLRIRLQNGPAFLDYDTIKDEAKTVLREFLTSLGHRDVADTFIDIIEAPDEEA